MTEDINIQENLVLAKKLKAGFAAFFIDNHKRGPNPERMTGEDLGACVMACSMLIAQNIAALVASEKFRDDGKPDLSEPTEVSHEVINKLVPYITALLSEARQNQELKKLAANSGNN